eukprot:Protomagalhaensia_wolfi_Nauph_80__672@NODE_1385_length_1554_cov_13_302970_g1071_i0_p1_GENE_NODE_1385_length_1554_cov_13_302970_g1071_i0NODE_1385_length_1554_cov_13_302970_g1071_i0_p1_ORF_typecomplete_len490_score83_50ANTH/PF07651_16/1_4e08ENTH/PF01417_20/0_21KAR9/PF08580_10/0_88_NODE_1385_length_1554_cov_13_302970_g1071_i0291498
MLKSLLDSITLLTLRGYDAAVFTCLSDDTNAPTLDQSHDVIEGLLGCRKDITGIEAMRIFDKGVSSRWTWKVVLKSLYIVHTLLKYQSTTPQWIQTFMETFTVLENMARFREGEGVDLQAESHSKLIRLYASYLRQLATSFIESTRVKARTKSRDFVSKSDFLDLANVVSTAHHQFKNTEIPYERVTLRDSLEDQDDEELGNRADGLRLLCQSALKVFVKPPYDAKKESGGLGIPLGFRELSTAVFLEIYRDIRNYMVMINILVANLIVRVTTYPTPADLANIKQVLTGWRTLAEQALLFTRFIQAMPELKIDLIPENPLASDKRQRELNKLAKKYKVSLGVMTPVDYSLEENDDRGRRSKSSPQKRPKSHHRRHRRRVEISSSSSSASSSERSLSASPAASSISISASESDHEAPRPRAGRDSAAHSDTSARPSSRDDSTTSSHHRRQKRHRQPPHPASSRKTKPRKHKDTKKSKSKKQSVVGLLDLA